MRQCLGRDACDARVESAGDQPAALCLRGCSGQRHARNAKRHARRAVTGRAHRRSASLHRPAKLLVFDSRQHSLRDALLVPSIHPAPPTPNAHRPGALVFAVDSRAAGSLHRPPVCVAPGRPVRLRSPPRRIAYPLPIFASLAVHAVVVVAHMHRCHLVSSQLVDTCLRDLCCC